MFYRTIESDAGITRQQGVTVAEHETISDRLFQRLRAEILSGELAQGGLHSIYALAERFDVSRTPTRDAVLRLADAGLVTIERNRGVRVRGIGVDDIRRIFELRLLLEVPATRFAAAHQAPERSRLLEGDLEIMLAAVRSGDTSAFVERDIVMHERILDAMGNERLVAQVRALREQTVVIDASTFGRSRSLDDVHAEHLPIVRAVIDGDVAAAGAEMTRHLVQTALLLMRQVAAHTGELLPANWPADFLVASAASQ